MSATKIDTSHRPGATARTDGGTGLAAVYGAGLWAAATALFIVLGDLLLPPIDRASTVPVLAALLVLTAVAVGVLAWDWMRRAGRTGPDAALGFGAVAATVGLLLDGVFVLAVGFDYPNVGGEETETLMVFLFLAYAVVIAVPPFVASRLARGEPR